MTSRLTKTVLAAACLASSQAGAALIAQYIFTDDLLTDNEVGATFELTSVGNGTGVIEIAPEGYAIFPGNDSGSGNQVHLETDGPGGKPNFTVSLWWRTDTFNQGNFQGLFANLMGTGSFSWQLDSNAADIRLVSNGNDALTFPESDLSTGTWYHTVIRKVGSDMELYTTAEGSETVTLKASQAGNPGGLQMFRLGTNRNADSFFRMDMANVQIYDDATVDLDALLTEGPMLTVVPEPAQYAAVFGLLAILLMARRRRT